MLAVSLMSVGIAILCLALFSMVRASGKLQQGTQDQLNANYIAEAGLSVAMMELASGVTPANANQGTEDQWIAMGDGSYWVDAVQNADGSISLTSTGVENDAGSRIELVVQEVPTSNQVWAAFGDEFLTLDSNAQVDSYNSVLGSYASQDVNGNGSNSFALSNGNIGSNGNIAADSNVKVFGDVTPGPTGSAVVTGNAVVSGSTAPATSLVGMPAIVIPTLTSLGDMNFDGSGSGAFHSFIPAGSHEMGVVEVDMSNLSIIGPATLVFDSLRIDSNSQVTIDASNGPVEIFVRNDFVLNSNAKLASITETPADLKINLISDNILDPNLNVDLDEVDFNSNASIYGTIYAPNASVEINSNFELFGALMARRVHLDSNAKVHFDEALMNSTNTGDIEYERVAWRQVPYQHN